MSSKEERRRAFRHRLAMPVRVRSHIGFRIQAVVTDLSEDGCALWFRGAHENIGTNISIQPEAMEAWQGRIVWKWEDRMGMQFERRLYAPVVRHLIERFPPF